MSNGSILVTGANGFVGSALCIALIKGGYKVRAAIRDTSRFAIEGGETVSVATLETDTHWGEALRGITTVIHLAARVHVMQDVASDPLEEFRRVNVAGTERLARSAAAQGVKRFVFVSSIKVNGESTSAEPFREDDRPAPQDPYGVSKLEAEEMLRRVAAETGMEVVIVRPPLVYGAGVKGNFATMLKVLSKGIPLPFASVNNRRSLVYVGNLVEALILCATHPAAGGRTYLVSDGEDISTSDLLRRLGAELGHAARLFPCPASLLLMIGRLTGKHDQMQRLLGSLRVDSGKIRRELGWMPAYSLQQGLQATAQGWRRNGEK